MAHEIKTAVLGLGPMEIDVKTLIVAVIGLLVVSLTGCSKNDGASDVSGAAAELSNVAGQPGAPGSTVQGNIVAQAPAAVRGSNAKADIIGTGTPGVVVTIQGTSLSVVTGADGMFTFYGILPGTYILQFSLGGAQCALQLTITGNDVIELRNTEIEDEDGDGVLEVEVEEVYVNGVEVEDEIEVVDDDAEDGQDSDVDENEIDDEDDEDEDDEDEDIDDDADDDDSDENDDDEDDSEED